MRISNLKNIVTKTVEIQDEASKLKKIPGFEIIFAIAGLIMITRLFKRKKF